MDEKLYTAAIEGRRHFRAAFRQKLEEARNMRATIVKALKHLDHATPSQRNGPVYQAADVLRDSIGLPPMAVGGRPSEGIED